MDQSDLLARLHALFPDAEFLQAGETVFVMYDPDHRLTPERRRPFLTLVADDAHDRASNLSRPGVYRLNIELTPEEYRDRFGPHPRSGPDGLVDTGHDFTALDTLMPHPVYAPMSWACVLSPGAATLGHLLPLIGNAHARAVRRHGLAAPSTGIPSGGPG
ncbi:DUF6194 family protein [Deinococcus koreensis]|uniref:DUF6194 family protein n=1 Tax=Deinococcus koreensis TaxID=2054903 RepID=UPI0013FE35B6|nr:DUF6194 family protein [Deinococcus koreensis]